MGRPRDYGADIHRATHGFTAAGQRVDAVYGFSDHGTWLRYLVVRSLPVSATTEEWQSDPRCEDHYELDRPRVRHPDGVMRKVQTDGHVYFFVGDELQTMRAEMTQGQAVWPWSGVTHTSLEGMWNHLQQYRVNGS